MNWLLCIEEPSVPFKLGFLQLARSVMPGVELIEMDDVTVGSDLCERPNPLLMIVNPQYLRFPVAALRDLKHRKEGLTRLVGLLDQVSLDLSHPSIFDAYITKIVTHETVHMLLAQSSTAGICDDAPLSYYNTSYGSDEARKAPLPPRQHEVLQLMAEGLPNKEIARRLDISPHTVRVHMSILNKRFGAQNRTALLRMALDRGLVA